MGFVGLVMLTLVAAGPAAGKIGGDAVASVTVRLARVATVLGVLAVPAVVTDLAHGVSADGGYDYPAAWRSLFDGTNAGRLLGLEVAGIVAGVVLVAPLTVRACITRRLTRWLLSGGLVAGLLALGTTKFPAKVPEQWGRTIFGTGMWMLHLFGGAVWIGGLIGLLALALPGGISAGERGQFWPVAIRRFSISAMTCVGAITLSGLWLYWGHVDGPSQLFTTMYGRVLGVKILLFAGLLLLGMVNQFWLHPKIEALRVAGDERPLRTVLVRQFPVVVAVEVVLGLAVLMVAPFLHGSARNQAFQAHAAEQSSTAGVTLSKIAPKQVSASTWVWGTGETVAVVAVMIGAYSASGRVARRRITAAVPPEARQLVDA